MSASPEMLQERASTRSASCRQDNAVEASAIVGVVGAGQLARMMRPAAERLGIELIVLADDGFAPAAGGRSVRLGSAQDLAALRGLAEECDVLSFDHEGVPLRHLEALAAAGHTLRPGPTALRAGQDKLHARHALQAAGFPVPAWTSVADSDSVEAFASAHGWPVVLKAARGGYDGRGVEVVGDRSGATRVLERGGAWIAEELVPIELELSQLVARSPSGEIASYPAIRTVQRDGICVEASLPAAVGSRLGRRASELAVAVAERIDATGVLAVELFVVDGEPIVNELALRPHNSGHLTIEACETSQFENHLRGILGWPLGSTGQRSPAAVMTNVIGKDGADPTRRVGSALAVPGAALHLYGKQPRAGRKLGHVTATGSSVKQARRASRTAAEILCLEPRG